MAWTSLCDLQELTAGQGKYVEIGGFQLAVFLNDGQVHVMDNECPHAGGSLAGGWVEHGCAVCPWHAWSFDLKTGDVRGELGAKVHVYPSRIFRRETGDLVQADLPMP